MKTLLGILLATAVPTQSHIPTAPALVPIPDINSEENQQRLAVEQSAALEKASGSRRSVARTFIVGWEMHHGLFLVPADARDWLRAKWSTPDFLTEELRDRLTVAAVPNAPDHQGQKLLCRCTGVEWSFYGQKRFLIRKADLLWK